MYTVEKVLDKLKNGVLQRVLGFGSSNTERFLSGMHWFDCVELGLQQTYGRVHRCINTGIGGHTTADLLARFEYDAAFYRPDLVFITIGGNDSNPEKDISQEVFRSNLHELHKRFCYLECAVVFQTYYAVGPEGHVERFHKYMQTVREVAEETGSALVDHLAFWEPFRLGNEEKYFDLKQDSFHVNYLGNMVMGLKIADTFSLKLGEDSPEFWKKAREYYRMMKDAG